jgi:UDP-3-O-[3-hydroxymyristoyl] glucosamine N-acyltransferase
MSEYTIQEIANALGTDAVGDLSYVVKSVSEPSAAGANQLALAMDESYSKALKDGSAQAAVLWEGADWQALGLKAALFAPRSRYVLSGISYAFEKKPEIDAGIHASAVIHPDAEIGENASIGPFVVIGRGAKIGKNSRILSHCTIGEDAMIGDNALLYPSVHIGARVMIGSGFISQSGSVVGADGFSYVTPKPGAVEEAKATGQISEQTKTSEFARINSLGAVVLGDDVELGANCTIDRGTIINTKIGSGTKLDNQVHIGHNVQVGSVCLLCGQVGIAGSTTIGDRVVLGGQVGVADQLTIGSDVIAAGKSGISSNVPSGRVMMGSPAMKMNLNIEAYKALRRLPRLVAKVAKLENLLSNNEEKS